jgi:dienelactone hydrolase
MIRALQGICVIVGLVWAQWAQAEPSVKDLATRTELRAVETLTLTDQQFLTGDKNGKPVTIAAQLRFPQGASGRLPVVMLQHGSGGLNAGHELWSKHFNEIGVASVLVDSFSGRGLTRTSTNQALLGRFNMILDAYRVLDVIANDARIDPTRIAIMGFSRGGQSALYSSLKRFQQSWSQRGTFAAHIPLYASCQAVLVGDTDVSPVPIRQFHGAADDYVPVAPCRGYFERLRAAGRDALLTEYPDAHHSYDNPLGNKTPTVAKGSQSVRACKLKEEPLGTIINAETGQPFTYKDPCVQTDPHTGYNEAAANATRKAVKDFVRTVFKLDAAPAQTSAR